MEFIKKNKSLLLAAIVIVVTLIFLINPNKKSGNKDRKIVTKNEAKLKIRKSEVSTLTLEDYESSVFTMKKPKGWTVSGAGVGMYYAIKVTDPNNTNNSIFLMLKIQPLLKSEASKNFWKDYSNLSKGQYKLFADSVVLDNPTVQGFYEKFGDIANYIKNVEPTLSSFDFPTYSNFVKIEEQEGNASMKSVALDSKVLRGTFTGSNNKKGEGLFLASIVNFGDNYINGIDTLYYMVYDIMAITADENEFVNYKDILLNSINSISFTDSYVKQTIDDGNAQTKKALELSASIQRAFDSYMSAWENRNKTYDIMSQKQSDATLGYERVYDTETNEIYKAYNGFNDDYEGQRYKSVTDEMYTQKTSGYIDK